MDQLETPSFRLDGHRALVTGAGRGLGLAMATALAEAGAHVVLTSRSRNELQAAADGLTERGLNASAAVCDVTDRAAFQALVDDRGPFHTFVNNAGVSRPAPALETSEEDFDFVMGVNVKAAYFCAQCVAKSMATASIKGSIINVSSQMGHVSGPKRALYSASKFAMEGFTRGMALELGAQGIRVNTICPTFIHTELTKVTFADPALRTWIESNIALDRIGKPEDVMGPVVFLASDASALMTGSSLMLDGGWTAA